MKCCSGELPEFKRCCFCFPLRLGLLAMGYIKLVISVLLLYPITVLLFMMYMFGAFHHYNQMTIELLQIIGVCVALLLDVSFNLVFIVAAHAKNYRMLRVYNRYALFALIANTLFLVILICLNIYWYSVYHKDLNRIFYLLGFGSAYSLAQFYLILLIRSQILKLSSKGEFRFVNNAAEAQCTFSPVPLQSEDATKIIEII